MTVFGDGDGCSTVSSQYHLTEYLKKKYLQIQLGYFEAIIHELIEFLIKFSKTLTLNNRKIQRELNGKIFIL